MQLGILLSQQTISITRSCSIHFDPHREVNNENDFCFCQILCSFLHQARTLGHNPFTIVCAINALLLPCNQFSVYSPLTPSTIPPLPPFSSLLPSYDTHICPFSLRIFFCEKFKCFLGISIVPHDRAFISKHFASDIFAFCWCLLNTAVRALV